MLPNHVRLDKTRIAVLAGGNSFEREISLKSGQAVSRALMERGHIVSWIDPASEDLTCYDFSQIDVAFLTLHGTFGEDGQVQQILESANVPYTGSNAIASELAFSKSRSKEKFQIAGVPTPDFAVFGTADTFDEVKAKAAEIGYPLVVKPDKQGSSIGVSIVDSEEGLSNAIQTCLQFDHIGIIEAAILGTEWTVGFVGSDALPLIKIETDRGFFDFDAKYLDDNTGYQFDFFLPQGATSTITSIARAACQALGTTGFPRVDLRVDSTLRPWVLEVNTIPGMTDHSLVPKAAERVGLSMGELCEQIVSLCYRAPAKPPHFIRSAAKVANLVDDVLDADTV